MADKRLFLLDGMALVYRAHFAFIARPIFTSSGLNTSALFGFTNTLLELIQSGRPTHLAAVFDSEAATRRHEVYRDYKATRQAMPEDLSRALPHLRRILGAFRIPILSSEGFEADDLIGTVARRAEAEGFETFMVTPDKDCAQLVSERTFVYKPSYKGAPAEVLGIPEVTERWGIQSVSQIPDLLGLAGDASDNIPGVPGIGPKTASRLLGRFGSLEGVLEHTAELSGKLRENLEANREQALLSKRLATIECEVPLEVDWAALELAEPDWGRLRPLLEEFEFRSLLRRLAPAEEPGAPSLQTAVMVPHVYRTAGDGPARESLLDELRACSAFAVFPVRLGAEAREAELLGFGFSWEEGRAFFVPLSADAAGDRNWLEQLAAILARSDLELAGHHLKESLLLLKRRGLGVSCLLFDSMIAQALLEPEQRQGFGFLVETRLRRVAPTLDEGGGGTSLPLAPADPERLAQYGAEGADLAWRLRRELKPLLAEAGQERVFYEIEAPLIPVLADMEHEGIALDTGVLAALSAELSAMIAQAEMEIFRLAGRSFNVNSPRQLGQVLFDELKLSESPSKTKTGQRATHEQVLALLAPRHEIVRFILEHRGLVKLKSTYVDALPAAISPQTGRVHSHFGQAQTATGRLQSDNPNLQNIPIRSEMGRKIRRAFIARDPEHRLISADYSQIELRIIAALSGDPGMLEAFTSGRDVHAATAARVYGVAPDGVTREMRAKAKMVNFGIPYGISAFGLAQRLNVPRGEAAALIEQYFREFTGIRDYIDRTLAFAREHGYVETICGRRRYLRDVHSRNATVRAAAERNAINMPIQGTAADMIKIAMATIHGELHRRGLRARLLLQVHDELVLESPVQEVAEVRDLVEEAMKGALPLSVPIVVDAGVGQNWLEAH